MEWVNVGLGLLLIGVSIPLALGKVPPNWLYGFRTRKTMSSPEIWYPANRALGRDGIVAGIVVTIASAVVAVAFRGQAARIASTNSWIMVVALAVIVIRGLINLRRL